MKKMKLLLVVVALFAVGSAFTPINDDACDGVTLYQSDGTLAGDPSTYRCVSSPGDNCLFYMDGEVLTPCPGTTNQKYVHN